MKKQKMQGLVITSLLTMTVISAVSINATASAGVQTRSQRAANACLTAITNNVRAARVGQPARAIPWVAQGRVAAEVQRAIKENLSWSQANARFMSRLSVIQNRFWRRDLANAAAGLVSNPPRQCR